MAELATRNRDEALDLVQDTMFKLVQRYVDRDESEWGPLFYRILQNRIQDWHRRNWVRTRWRVWFQGDPESEEGEGNPIEHIPDPTIPDPTDQIAKKRAAAALDGALHELPLRQQQAFLLRAWEGYDVAETARSMGCSEGSVKTHYSRAVHTLRKRLEDHWP